VRRQPKMYSILQSNNRNKATRN